MEKTVSQAFDEAREALIELGLRLDPSKISPETMSSVCRFVGETLSCLGLAEYEEEGFEFDLEHDLAVG